mmetsp:Transcript_29828/g.63505  ORF Transcript_29828/g.63505 Transcript_29828/m.63505 type:complete len:84 (-) Transcript_29828:2-253(-)
MRRWRLKTKSVLRRRRRCMMRKRRKVLRALRKMPPLTMTQMKFLNSGMEEEEQGSRGEGGRCSERRGEHEPSGGAGQGGEEGV